MAKASSRERLAKHSKGGKDLECQSWQNRFHFRNGQDFYAFCGEACAFRMQASDFSYSKL